MVNENEKKISDGWKAFLDALIQEADDGIKNFYDSQLDFSFAYALRVIQHTLKENGIFEIGE